MRIKKMLFIGLIDAIATQIFVNIIPGNFRISLAVAILPVFYYVDRELNPIYTSFFIMLIGAFFRVTLTINDLINNFSFEYIEINIFVFDIVYATIFYYFFYKKKNKDVFSWISVVFFADLFSNIAELISRDAILMKYLNQLIIVAFIRSIIALFFLLLFYYFMDIFKKEIDRKKYYDLLGLFSDIKSEVYLMNNNVKYIENIMTDAYLLYDNLENNSLDENKKQALDIAQHVHEIKKNYLGILTGLNGVDINNDIYQDMTFFMILDILEKNVEKFIDENNAEIRFIVKRNENFYVKKHYYLMSVLRNLVNNSVESLMELSKKDKKIILSYRYVEGEIDLTIHDNGKGIKDKDLEYIYNEGFSTKFTNDGKIHRGLGLTLVKKIVENEFLGELKIESKYKFYTTIHLILQIEKSEEEHRDEILYY